MPVTRTQSKKNTSQHQETVASLVKAAKKRKTKQFNGDACRKCNRKVSANASAVKCDECGGWIHCSCAGIPKELYACLQKFDVPVIKIVCLCCSPPKMLDTNIPPAEEVNMVRNDGPNNTEQPGAAEFVTNDTLDSLRAYRTPSSTPSKESKPRTERITRPPPTVEDYKPGPFAAEATRHDRVVERNLDRSRCLIMVNAAEPSGETAAERIQQERQFLHSVFLKLFDDGEQGTTIVSAFRLGRKSADDCKPRPLKIVLGSEAETKRILSRVWRLKGEPFRLLRDLSPEERQKMKKATEELRQRLQSGETDLHIVDFRVVKRKPRIRWRPLSVRPQLILI